MGQNLCYFGSLFFLMLITGVFWGTWFTMTRSIESFSADEFIHIGKVIISNVAWPMRFILPSGIALLILSLVFYSKTNSASFYFGLLSLILLIAVLLTTVAILVPIDNKIKTWTTDTIPKNWERIRAKWKLFHVLRTFFSLIAFASYSLFLLLSTNISLR